MLPQLLALTLALVPSFAAAAIFPPDSLVKMLDAKGFRKAMKENRTTLVAFVAPWCGHCQKMAPEYSKAALGLYPLVPTYAVDCDAEKNKRLCAEQGVKGFPTVKLFPRGNTLTPIPYQGDRTANAIFNFASKRIPNNVQGLHTFDDILTWVAQKVDRPRLVLLTKEKKIPMLWQVLDNQYKDHFVFGSHLDRKGKTSIRMGYEPASKKESKVLLYPVGSKKPIPYDGINKYEPLTKFLNSVLNGTADLKVANEPAKAKEFVTSPEDIEVERQQEAQHGEPEKLAKEHGTGGKKAEPASERTQEPVDIPIASTTVAATEREPLKDEL